MEPEKQTNCCVFVGFFFHVMHMKFQGVSGQQGFKGPPQCTPVMIASNSSSTTSREYHYTSREYVNEMKESYTKYTLDKGYRRIVCILKKFCSVHLDQISKETLIMCTCTVYYVYCTSSRVY